MRLAQIRREFGADVAIAWRSFLLRPDPQPKSLEKFRTYTQSWKVPAGQPGAGRFRVWSTDEAPPSHSVPPGVAVKAAARQLDEDGFERFHLALMDTYFYANRNVTERQTLIDVATECGLDVETFTAALADDSVEREVLADHKEAVGLGISGVPTVVVDGEWQIPGALDIDFYRHLIAKRLATMARLSTDAERTSGGTE